MLVERDLDRCQVNSPGEGEGLTLSWPVGNCWGTKVKVREGDLN